MRDHALMHYGDRSTAHRNGSTLGTTCNGSLRYITWNCRRPSVSSSRNMKMALQDVFSLKRCRNDVGRVLETNELLVFLVVLQSAVQRYVTTSSILDVPPATLVCGNMHLV